MDGPPADGPAPAAAETPQEEGRPVFHLISDAHLEFYGSNFRRFTLAIPGFATQAEAALKRTYLLLPGDIGDPGTITYAAFIRRCARLYRRVFLLTGNHEYYHVRPPSYASRVMAEALNCVRRVCSEFDNVHHVEDGAVDAGAFVVVGATLWGRLPEDPQCRQQIAARLSDLRHIYIDSSSRSPISAAEYCELSAAGERSLRAAVAEAALLGKPVVVMTHHAPCPAAVSSEARAELRERFGDLPEEELLAPYAGAVQDFFFEAQSPIALWVHGHCHCSSRVTLGGIDVVCNAVGYKDCPNASFAIADLHLPLPRAAAPPAPP